MIYERQLKKVAFFIKKFTLVVDIVPLKWYYNTINQR